MTSRLHKPIAFPDEGRYDRLVEEALQAFGTDVVYAIQVVESARSISTKKRNATRKSKSKV